MRDLDDSLLPGPPTADGGSVTLALVMSAMGAIIPAVAFGFQVRMPPRLGPLPREVADPGSGCNLAPSGAGRLQRHGSCFDWLLLHADLPFRVRNGVIGWVSSFKTFDWCMCVPELDSFWHAMPTPTWFADRRSRF